MVFKRTVLIQPCRVFKICFVELKVSHDKLKIKRNTKLKTRYLISFVQNFKGSQTPLKVQQKDNN